MKLIERIATRLGYVPVKKSSWDKMWLRAIESQLVEGKISKPYKQHWAVYLAISKIATNIAQVPFAVYRGDEQVWEHPVLELLSKPNSQLSRFQLWEATVIFLNLKGECFWLLEESRGQAAGTSRIPSAIWVFNPEKFRPALDSKRNLTGWMYRGQVPLKLEEVIHFKFFNPYDDIRGLSPLEAARISMDTDYRAMKYNQSFFKNSAEPSAVLKTQGALSDEQFKRLRAQWEARHRGESRAHKIAILEGGLDYEKVGLSHRDMDFLEQRKFSLEEILGVFGVPKAIALTQDLRYATALVQRRAFWNDTLLPQMRLIKEKLNAEFFPRVAPELRGEFDTDQIEELREDLKEKAEVAEKLVKMGFTANEVNDRLDLGFEAKPWRDIWWVGINMVPADTGATPPEERAVRTMRQLTISPQLPPPHPPTAGWAKEQDARRQAIRRQFLVKQQALEKAFEGKIKRYLFEQRARVLRAIQGDKELKIEPEELLARIALIWQEEEDRLALVVRPLYGEATGAGGQMALDNLGLGISFDLQSPEAIQVISSRVNKIKGITDTIWRQLRSEIREGLGSGETIAQVSERIRKVYNMASNRSKVIARTETAGAMNEASFTQYKAHGVQRKSWITAHDENVRETHVAAEAQGPIGMAQVFTNGLKYPGDPEGGPEEVINCRCTLVPEVEV
ncbi:MAG: phage portal protein [Deltaproteobacteria bacterium]|nr:phage portal protein [Deltaproteobacteria bacterium]MBW2081680.1 phage portal protein [Deltaproteobacteria bacterium]MBW2298875.1 phage portal protein [Deltaproteobacteria bacterium]